MTYRNSSQIVAAMLDATKESGMEGITPTLLLKKTNITHSRLRRLTTNLTGAGLMARIESDGRHAFAITPKGIQYLELYREFHSMAESFGLEL